MENKRGTSSLSQQQGTAQGQHHMNERPKLDFVTLVALWRPEVAFRIVDAAARHHEFVSPKAFRRPTLSQSLSIKSTVSEIYTIQFVRYLCDFAFGGISGKGIPDRQQIWTRNVLWLKYHVRRGQGIDFTELRRLLGLYTQHILEDNNRPPNRIETTI